MGTSQAITAVVAGLIAIILELVPFLKAKWDKQFNSTQKQIVIAGGVLVISLGSAFYSCRYNDQCPVDIEKFVVDLVLTIIVGLTVAKGAQGSVKYIASPKESD